MTSAPEPSSAASAADENSERLPRQVYLLLSMELVSAVGSGLVLPFTSIYLFRIRHVPVGLIGLLIGSMAVAGLLGSLVSGWLEGRLPPRRVGQVGLTLQGIGFTLVGQLSSFGALAAAFVVVGVGTGLANPMLGVLLARLTPTAAHSKAFATSHWMLNLGIGVGALAGGLLLGSLQASRFSLVYALNGVTFLLLAVGLFALPERPGVVEPETVDRPRSKVTYLSLLGQQVLVLVLLAQLATEALGFSQLDSSVTLLLNRIAFSPRIIGLLIAANTVTVIALQLPLNAWTKQVDRARLLSMQSGIWLVGYLLAWLATQHRSAASLPLLTVFFMLFAVGECLYSSVLMPLLNQVSSPEELGRVFALASLISSTSKLFGPTIGLTLVGSAHPMSLWVLTVAGALITIGCATRVSRLTAAPAARPAVVEPDPSGTRSA